MITISLQIKRWNQRQNRLLKINEKAHTINKDHEPTTLVYEDISKWLAKSKWGNQVDIKLEEKDKFWNKKSEDKKKI